MNPELMRPMAAALEDLPQPAIGQMIEDSREAVRQVLNGAG